MNRAGCRRRLRPEGDLLSRGSGHTGRRLKLGRPVKWIEDRREHFLCATQEREPILGCRHRGRRDAKILGVRGKMVHDSGAFVPWGIIMPYIAAATVPGPLRAAGLCARHHGGLHQQGADHTGARRRPAAAVFAMERLLDRVAHELGIDRAEVRRRNFIGPEQMPYAVGLIFRDGKPLVYDSGDYPRGQETALAAAEYESFRERQRAARDQGASSASVSAITSRVPGSARSKASPSGCCRAARSRSRPAPPIRARAHAPRCHRSWPSKSAAADDIVMTIGDTGAIAQGVGAFASRQAVNAGSSAFVAGRRCARN